ncbi:MAG TPA: NUDIX hydrolase [Candidatus Methylomirabilis sp.]|nr:NUDIX hydrolase [Candidatus Methylomirabilis sp.]
MAKDLSNPGRTELQTFHSFSQADYVNIVAVTADRRVPLVRQYRAAVERYTLELPGGLCELKEDPVATAKRELMEETGYRVVAEPELLGRFYPDPGRLENRLWGFFASGIVADPAAGRDDDVELIVFERKELVHLVLDGKIEHAGHAGLIALAALKGLI